MSTSLIAVDQKRGHLPAARLQSKMRAVFGTGSFDSYNAQGERLIRQVTVAFMILRLEICDWNIYLPKSGGEPNCSIPVNYNVTHIVNSMVEYQKGACTFLAD
jgi:hypothetical protein